MLDREMLGGSFPPAEAIGGNCNDHAKSRGTRNIVEVVFAFTNRTTDYTEKVVVRCDMTEEFPFLVTKLSPYYDR